MVEKDKHEKPETIERTFRHLLRVAQHRLHLTTVQSFAITTCIALLLPIYKMLNRQ